MRTATTHARKGIASGLLRHILAEALKRGFERVSLETGSYEAFSAARRLYEKFGFKKTAIFKKELKYKGKYYDDLIMEKFL